MNPNTIETAASEPYERLGPQPAEALTRLMAMRKILGITRVADITGLDRVGIPVVQVVRPFSHSNAVSQGKGATVTQAAISAILESAETCFAERLSHFDTVSGTANSLNIPSNRFDTHLQPGAAPGWRDRETEWVVAEDLLSGSRDLVPFEIVHTSYVVPSPPEGMFAASTTGLAASFAGRDAIVHGILECVERDAIARANQTHGFFQQYRIDPRTINDRRVCDLLEALRAKGLLVGLWQVPSPAGVPVVWCHLMEDGQPQTALLHYPADGSAASFSPAAAITHAIYEAAQSRLAAISGARDDMTRALYPKYPDWQMIAAHRRLLGESAGKIDFQKITEGRIDDTEDPLSALLAALKNSGANAVLMVRLDTKPLPDLVVVKILIPALQPLLQG